MSVNLEGGQSVYCRENSVAHSQDPLYQSVRELIRKYTRTYSVADLGCSCLPASGQLINEGFKIFGFDLASDALHKGHNLHPQAHLAQVDLINPPFDQIPKVDTVLFIDVLEHFSKIQATNLLHTVTKLFPARPLTVIASLPIISNLSSATHRERAEMKALGTRPEIGLFDRTHADDMLLSRGGHHRFFARSGFTVLEEGYTWAGGVSGLHISGAVDPLENNKGNESEKSLKRQMFELLTLVSPSLALTIHRIWSEYQGLYVLKPNS